jgi:phosphohistidine phosphatase SixA
VSEINRDYSRLGSILIVGHEPYLSKLISVLLSGEKNILVTMKKGGICKLSVPDLGRLRYGRCATLKWLLPPAHILPGE